MATRNIEPGEKVRLYTPKGKGIDAEASESCHGEGGHWFCATHPDASVPNNISMTGHVQDAPGDHVEVWVCHVHGPEVP